MSRWCRLLGLFVPLVLLAAGQARAGELRVLTLGDSVVEGNGANLRTPLKKLLEAEGLAIAYVGTTRDADGNLHEAHGGWTPAQLLLKFHGNIEADVYVVSIGLNGLTVGTLMPSATGYGSHVDFVQGVLDAIYARNPRARVVLAQLVHGRGPLAPQSPLIAEYNRQLGLMVRAYGHEGSLWLVDLDTAFAGDPAYFLDGIHPNQAGYAVMAKALLPAVRAAALAARPMSWAARWPAQWQAWAVGILAAALALVAALRLRRSRQGPQG